MSTLAKSTIDNDFLALSEELDINLKDYANELDRTNSAGSVAKLNNLASFSIPKTAYTWIYNNQFILKPNTNNKDKEPSFEEEEELYSISDFPDVTSLIKKKARITKIKGIIVHTEFRPEASYTSNPKTVNSKKVVLCQVAGMHISSGELDGYYNILPGPPNLPANLYQWSKGTKEDPSKIQYDKADPSFAALGTIGNRKVDSVDKNGVEVKAGTLLPCNECISRGLSTFKVEDKTYTCNPRGVMYFYIFEVYAQWVEKGKLAGQGNVLREEKIDLVELKGKPMLGAFILTPSLLRGKAKANIIGPSSWIKRLAYELDDITKEPLRDVNNRWKRKDPKDPSQHPAFNVVSLELVSEPTPENIENRELYPAVDDSNAKFYLNVKDETVNLEWIKEANKCWKSEKLEKEFTSLDLAASYSKDKDLDFFEPAIVVKASEEVKDLEDLLDD